jgi:hypothetical protein
LAAVTYQNYLVLNRLFCALPICTDSGFFMGERKMKSFIQLLDAKIAKAKGGDVMEWKAVIKGQEPKGKVLAAYRNRHQKWRRICAQYVGKFEIEAESDFYDDTGDYCEEKDAYFLPSGWYELIENWSEYSMVFVSDEITYFCNPGYPKDEDAKEVV